MPDRYADFDYCEVTRHGGNLSDMPQPLRRMWPGARRKRRVRLQMLVWWGIGRHYHTSLEEEDNSVWDGEQWCVPWNDQEGKGQHLNDIFVTENGAPRNEPALAGRS